MRRPHPNDRPHAPSFLTNTMASSSHPGVRGLTAVAATAALALILGYIKLYRLPQGGSITLEAVPILFLALWQGIRPGILAGLLTGILKLLFGPFIVHPVQLLLDYPLPFALLGLSAATPRAPRTGVLLGSLARWFSHFTSGIVFFGSYAPEGVSVWRYSALYNLSYIGPEALIALLLVPPLLRRIPDRT